MKLIALILIPFLLSSCHRQILQVRSEYLNPTYLSAERVDTPDPCRKCFWGQQVIVHWMVPRHLYCDNLNLIATFRFGNREMEQVRVPITTPYGYWVYRLVNAPYWRKCGILSYKVDMLLGDVVINSWRHHVWSDIIEISD